MSHPAAPSDRLTGWKDVAAFLGKGVRTVQRWETGLGLPIHRVGRDGGESVFAFRSEIARWQAAQELARKAGPAAAPPARPDDTRLGLPLESRPVDQALAARRRAAVHAAAGALGATAVLLGLWLLAGPFAP